MLTVFNRKRLVVTYDNDSLYACRRALREAGIPCQAKAKLTFSSVFNKGAGIPGLASEHYHYVLYVHAADLERGHEAIAPLLQSEAAAKDED